MDNKDKQSKLPPRPELYTTCVTPNLPGMRCPGTCDDSQHCPVYIAKNSLSAEILTR